MAERDSCFSGSGNCGVGPLSLSKAILLGNEFDSWDFPALEVQLELGRELDLQLDRRARVLLGPKIGEYGRDPLPYRKEAMDLGVAGGAEDY